MASFTKNLCFLILVTILVCSTLQTYARESHFFSKVSRNRDNDDIDLLKKNENEAKLFEEQLDLQEEQPSFIPQTSDTNGYGLYGHETGLNSPSTTTTTTTGATPVSLLDKDGQVDDKNNKKLKDEKNYVPELTGLSESSYTNNNAAENKYDTSNIVNNNDKNREIVENDRVVEKNYVPQLTRTSEASYTNNVGPTEYVAENNYNNLNHHNHKYDNEVVVGNDRKEKNYVPELTGLSEYVAENNYNNNHENDIFGYNPESTRMSNTRYTNNVVPSNYVAENNYNNINNNNNNDNEIFGNNPEFIGLRETYRSNNNVVPRNYFPENNYNNGNNNNNNNNNNYKNERRYYTSEKQGMSDTRYLENGKYFYAFNDAKKFYPTYSNNYNNNRNNNNNNNNNYFNGNEMQQKFEDQP